MARCGTHVGAEDVEVGHRQRRRARVGEAGGDGPAGGRGYPGGGGAEDADRPGRGRDRIGAEVRVDEDRRRRQHGDARGDWDRAGSRHHRGLPFRGERDERRRRRGGGAMAVDHGEAGGVAGGIRALMSTDGT